MGVTQRDISIAQTAGTAYSSSYNLNDYLGFSIIASWTDDTASFTAKTFDTGVKEVSTITYPTYAGATHGDYTVAYDTAGGKWAVALSKAGIAEVYEITCLADVVAVANVSEIVADTRTNTSDGQYFDIDAQDGSLYRVYMDITGGDSVQPAAGGRTLTRVDISGGADTAANVGDLVAGVLHALADFGCPATGTGTIEATDANAGAVTAGVIGDLTGLWAISATTPGVTAALLDGKYITLQDVGGSVGVWVDTDDGGGADPTGATRDLELNTVTSGMTADQVAGVLATLLDGDAKYAASATGPVVTVTCADLKDLTDPVDGDSGFTFNVTTQGVDLGAAPTGVAWAAVPSANKVQADISADTTAAQVAARCELAWDGLTGFTPLITTADPLANGTLDLTSVAVGVVTDTVVKNADDSGAGSITAASSPQGVDEEVAIATEYLSIPTHGFIDDLHVEATTTGTLPAGLSTATPYYVIVVNANTIQLSASAGGAAINLTDTGTGVHTLTAETTMGGTITVQASHDDSTFIDTSTTITISASPLSALKELSDKYYKYVRLKNVVTEGVATVTATIQTKY